MADRSQLPVQIMENQTRFDLNAAIENWRNELAAQPDLASDDRRELETHLRDAVAGFQQRGLSDEESFWLARRRVGQPQQLGEEFVKADPAKVWRERIFWMAIAIFALELWGSFNDLLWRVFPNFLGRPDPVCLIMRTIISFAPLLWLVSSLVLGRLTKESAIWKFLFRSRLFFVGAAIVLYLAVHFLSDYALMSQMAHSFPNMPRQILSQQLQLRRWLSPENLTMPCFLIALIVWLMPTQNRKTPKLA